jgi:hypothetical protein
VVASARQPGSSSHADAARCVAAIIAGGRPVTCSERPPLSLVPCRPCCSGCKAEGRASIAYRGSGGSRREPGEAEAAARVQAHCRDRDGATGRRPVPMAA